MAVNLIIRYYLPSALNIIYLAEIFINDYTIGIVDIVREHPGIVFLSMLIQTIMCIPPMMLGFSLGNKKRKRERENLISHNN